MKVACMTVALCPFPPQTRIQRERFTSMDDYNAARGKYIIDGELMKIVQPHAVVLHPLPRVDEVRPGACVLAVCIRSVFRPWGRGGAARRGAAPAAAHGRGAAGRLCISSVC